MTTNVEVGLHGLQVAVKELLNTEMPLAGSAAVGTGAFWACALDEQLRAVDGKYDSLRDADSNGSLLPGLRLVRNAVTHGAVVAVRPSEGLVFPLRFPLTFSSLVFRPLSDVVSSWVGVRHAGRENAKQDAVYSARVAHQRTAEPLRSALAWFEQYTGVRAQ